MLNESATVITHCWCAHLLALSLAFPPQREHLLAHLRQPLCETQAVLAQLLLQAQRGLVRGDKRARLAVCFAIQVVGGTRKVAQSTRVLFLDLGALPEEGADLLRLLAITRAARSAITHLTRRDALLYSV